MRKCKCNGKCQVGKISTKFFLENMLQSTWWEVITLAMNISIISNCAINKGLALELEIQFPLSKLEKKTVKHMI